MLTRGAAMLAAGSAHACIDAGWESEATRSTLFESVAGSGDVHVTPAPTRDGMRTNMVDVDAVDAVDPLPFTCPDPVKLRTGSLASAQAVWSGSDVKLTVQPPSIASPAPIVITDVITTPELGVARAFLGTAYVIELSLPAAGGSAGAGAAGTARGAAAGSGGASGASGAGGSAPDAPWPQSITVRVRFDCRGMPLVRYEIELVLDTSAPMGGAKIAVRPADTGEMNF